MPNPGSHPFATSAAEDLRRLLPGDRVFQSVSLAEISRWKVGGTADIVVRPRSTEELAALRRWIHDRQLPAVVVGATTNLLFSDEGLRAICIQIGQDFNRCRVSGDTIEAQAGAWVPGVARLALTNSLSGLEHTCGIPGTVGGLICMNGGSNRQSVGEVVERVVCVTPTGEVHIRSHRECGFSYRSSAFQCNQEIITEAVFKLERTSNKAACRRMMLTILQERRSKFPQKAPNCGSVFVSSPDLFKSVGPPGRVIESLGMKGLRSPDGRSQISPMHANFIVNNGGATSRGIVHLIKTVQAKVLDATGVKMGVEVRHVSKDGRIQPADTAYS